VTSERAFSIGDPVLVRTTAFKLHTQSLSRLTNIEAGGKQMIRRKPESPTIDNAM
jgi:hypothetical protein